MLTCQNLLPKKPKFRRIKTIENHPHADRLEIVSLFSEEGVFIVEKGSMDHSPASNFLNSPAVLFVPGTTISVPLADKLGISKLHIKKATFRSIRSNGLLVSSANIIAFLNSLILPVEKQERLNGIRNLLSKPIFHVGPITKRLECFTTELLWSPTIPTIKKATSVEVHLLDF